MGRFGFVGPTYQSQSPRADCERCVNLYVESMEAPAAKSPASLFRTPGLKTFCTLADSPLRGLYTFFGGVGNGRTFAVAGTSFFEVFQDGSSMKYGTVANDGLMATMAANNGSQLAIASGGTFYLLNLANNVMSQPAGLLAAVSQVVFCDDYFAVLLADGRLQVSGILDGTSWPGLQVSKVSVFADQPIGIISDHREIWLCSRTRSVGYINTGSVEVFDPIGPSAFVESGAASPYTVLRADNTIFWIESDERGQGIARRASGYTPQRISTHAVEYAWSQYPTISDAIGYSYQDQGHIFVVFYFPSADATWVYDVATSMWHERGYWDAVNGRYQAHRSNCHTANWGKHLVGDPQSGKIYDMAIGYLDDDGNNIRRLRISPPISNENEWIRHTRLQIDCEVGIGPMPPLTDGSGNARGPQIALSWSDDGGRTWSNDHFIDVGQQGKYLTRAIWRRLGRSRQRNYRIAMVDTVAWAIVEADLIASPGFTPTERLVKQYAKMS